MSSETVSVIIPTKGRPQFLQSQLSRIEAFERFPISEVIIIDDRSAPSWPRPQQDALICGMVRKTYKHYVPIVYRAVAGGTIASKRNLACSLARGSVIAHVDDDDWYSGRRITEQLSALSEGVDVVGVSPMPFSRWFHRDVAEWEYIAKNPMDCPEAGLIYRRAYWERRPFNAECVTGEGRAFLSHAAQEERIAVISGQGLMLASIHDGNTCPRQLAASNYRRIS